MNRKFLSLDGQVVSAPLANISGSAYRLLARRYGAALVYSEMISVDGLLRGSRKSIEKLKIRELEKPVCFQIFGHDPFKMAEAARMAAQSGGDMIDINFGCPAKKIVKNFGGASLLRDLQLVEKIIASVVRAVDLPVSVKFRSGWDQESQVFLEIGRMAEACGVSYLVLHPRTKTAGFAGKSDWSRIKCLKESVSIQVIGSGDITQPQEARQMLDETGCDGVMIGRAALGAPWVFQRMDSFLKTGNDPGEPSLEQRIETMLEFARLMIEDFGERSACLQLRKHLAWFTRGWHNVSVLRARMFSVESYADIEYIFRDYLPTFEKMV